MSRRGAYGAGGRAGVPAGGPSLPWPCPPRAWRQVDRLARIPLPGATPAPHPRRHLGLPNPARWETEGIARREEDPRAPRLCSVAAPRTPSSPGPFRTRGSGARRQPARPLVPGSAPGRRRAASGEAPSEHVELHSPWPAQRASPPDPRHRPTPRQRLPRHRPHLPAEA